MAAAVLAAPLSLAQSDVDGDGIASNVDNCMNTANADQRDSDGDGIGNACDADLNNDCIVNAIDLGIFRTRFFSTDADADLNGDGVVNPLDLGIFKQQIFSVPGPSGGQSLCSCVPPDVVPQSGSNAEFGGDVVYLVGSLAGDGAAIAGLNDFADQGNGRYLARIWAASAGTYDYRVANQSGTIDYCSDTPLGLYEPLGVPAGACVLPAGQMSLPGAGCYEFALQAQGSVPPAAVELTVGQRLGFFEATVDPSGGMLEFPNGVVLNVPAGAVGEPTQIRIGDVACAQIDALFAATTLSSHSNRCIGGFMGEPAGLAFGAPIALRAPVAQTAADEIVLWLASVPGRQDYTLVETALSYDAEQGFVDTAVGELAIFAAAGAVNRNQLPFRGGGLPPCCDVRPTPIGCCCTRFNVTSSAGDAFDSSCDCELLGNSITIEFPSCPGSPVFLDNESHSSENCPTDFQATLTQTDLIQWSCETREVGYQLVGTNDDGAVCNMAIPLDWGTDDPAVATAEGNALGTSATVTGVSGGDTMLNAVSTVGGQFSITAPLSIVDLNGLWQAEEFGEQTCTVDGGDPVTSEDMEQGLVTVAVPATCDEITIDILGTPSGLDATNGPFAQVNLPPAVFGFSLDAEDSANTLGCFAFFESDAQGTDFGDPFCTLGADCVAISCLESIETEAFLLPAAIGAGAGFSQWTIEVGWTEEIDGQIELHTGTCTGSSSLAIERDIFDPRN